MKSKFKIKDGMVLGLKLELKVVESLVILAALYDFINNEERNANDRIQAMHIRNTILSSLKKNKSED